MNRTVFCRGLVVAVGACLLVLTAAVVRGAEAPANQKPLAYPAEMNKQFADPNVDVQQFVKRFESESRDIYAKRHDIARSVGLRPGDAVADIGAGTGLFTQLFAEQVGPKGTVYAVDIGPAFVKYIAQEAKRLGREQVVKTVLNTPDSAELPPGSIDVAFLCDTYHHFEHPEKMLASIHRALRPGGRLVIIDFDLHKDSREYLKQRARAKRNLLPRDCGRRLRAHRYEECSDDQGQLLRGVPAGGPQPGSATRGNDRPGGRVR